LIEINPDLELYPYQEEGVEQMLGSTRVLLADEMGLGKTIQALMTMARDPNRWLPALVVCTASVKYHWAHDALRHVGMRSFVCEGQTPPEYNYNEFSSPAPLTIINYDILKYWVGYLRTLGFRSLFLDECQKIQNPQTQRSKATFSLAEDFERIVAMSGTPLTNHPLEMWPVLQMLWPDTFYSWHEFTQNYCNPKWTPWGWDFTGASNLGELHNTLKNLGMIRRRKVDVLKDLPEKVFRIIPCELAEPDEYFKAKDDFIGWLEKNMSHKVRSAKRAESLTRVGYLLRLTAKLKLRGVVDWINRFLEETEEKIVLFSVHTKAIEALQRRIPYKSVKIDGSVSAEHRQLAVEQFQKDKDTRVLHGNIQAAGVGITLTAASNVGFVELSPRPADHDQASDRHHRIGQKNTCFVNYFIAPETLEYRACQLLQTKKNVIHSILDGGTAESDFNLYEELLEELKKGM